MGRSGTHPYWGNFSLAHTRDGSHGTGVTKKLFYTGPVVNTEMLVVMLEKHGIMATHEIAAGESDDENDLNRTAQVFVPEADYDRAHRLVYAEREDEL
jgi:hypothetical protein